MRGEDSNRNRSFALISAIVDEFRRKHLLLRASGIGFRVLVATIPATLFVIALLGSLGLEELWTEEAVPELRANVSAAVFVVIDSAVGRVLGSENQYWITIGGLVTLWSMASIVQGVTETLNRIHEVEDERSFLDRAVNAFAIGAASGILILAAIAVVRLGPFAFDAILGDGFVVGVLSFVVRWALAVGLLVLVVILMKRVAPPTERPVRRLALGSAITVAGWVVMSLLFGLYLEYVAQYDSIFGNLATIYVAFQYIALSATVYVVGLVVDSLAVKKVST
jgi:membrane protein